MKEYVANATEQGNSLHEALSAVQTVQEGDVLNALWRAVEAYRDAEQWHCTLAARLQGWPWRLEENVYAGAAAEIVACALVYPAHVLSSCVAESLAFFDELGERIIEQARALRFGSANISPMLIHKVAYSPGTSRLLVMAETAFAQLVTQSATSTGVANQAPIVQAPSAREDSRRGSVYLLVNAAMPGLVKVGKTRGLANDRAKQLTAPTGVPSPFVVVHELECTDCDAAERAIHAELADARWSANREFFQVTVAQAIDVMRSLVPPLPSANPTIGRPGVRHFYLQYTWYGRRHVKMAESAADLRLTVLASAGMDEPPADFVYIMEEGGKRLYSGSLFEELEWIDLVLRADALIGQDAEDSL